MSKKIIFHLPQKIDRNRASASQIRPFKLIDAFIRIGYEVDLIEGYGCERKKQILQIKKNIKAGVKYDFLYSESSTMPTLLTEKHHYPTYPTLDFSFFSFCKASGIKIGLFYRDIYWCFDASNKGFKEKIAKYFYLYDLKKYNELVDVLFLPSLEMAEYIPFTLKKEIKSLPSGLDVNVFDDEKKQEDLNVNILYIGGIGPLYNIEKIVKVVGGLNNVTLKICCRKDDWDQVKSIYLPDMKTNVSIVHKSGKDIADLYKQADLFNIFIEPNEYRKFAVPFKLFEAIGYGCPVLASKGTFVGAFVADNNIGIVCDYDDRELKKALLNIINNKKVLHDYKVNIKNIALSNTWENRCLEIQNALL